jgi:hypothetical protein
MFNQDRLGHNGTETSWAGKPDEGDDQMNEKEDQIAHFGMVSKPAQKPDFVQI